MALSWEQVVSLSILGLRPEMNNQRLFPLSGTGIRQSRYDLFDLKVLLAIAVNVATQRRPDAVANMFPPPLLDPPLLVIPTYRLPLVLQVMR